MNNPYISTYLLSDVRILPNQMNNNIRQHIKNNLETQHVGRCFGDYGYVVKVHEIEYNKDAKIIPEDPMCCARFNVKFLCTICRPLKNSFIIGKLIGITEPMLVVSYGPLEIIVRTAINVNKNIFVFNEKVGKWTAKKGEIMEDGRQKYTVLKDGSYLKVQIISKKIIDKDRKILCMGYLENMATDDEIKKSITDSYEAKKYDNIEEYLDLENKIQKILEESDTLEDITATDSDENDI